MVDHVHVSIIHDITYIIVYISHLYSAYLCTLSLCQCAACFPWCCKGMAWIVCYKKHPPMQIYTLIILIMNELLLGIYRFRFIFIQKKTAKGPCYFYLFLKFVVVCYFSTLMVRLIVKCVNSNLVRFSERTQVNYA